MTDVVAAMTVLVWFLSEAAFPVSLGAGFALAVDVARRGPARVRHYRWRNRRFLKELRSRTLGRGGSEVADRSRPQGRSALAAGVEPRCPVPLAPPAPCSLVGAVGRQTAAPTRPPRVAVHG